MVDFGDRRQYGDKPTEITCKEAQRILRQKLYFPDQAVEGLVVAMFHYQSCNICNPKKDTSDIDKYASI